MEVYSHARTAQERDTHLEAARVSDEMCERQAAVIRDLMDENFAYCEKFGPVRCEAVEDVLDAEYLDVE